jgi:hypothetical protein
MGAMPGKSFTPALTAVVKSVTPMLKEAGFTRGRHTFNREVERGLIHVAGFQAGQFAIGNYEVPGLRANLWGKFTVNLGIFVNEVYVATQRRPPPEFVRDYDCEFRVRLGELMEPPADRWWPLDREFDTVVTEVREALRLRAMTWFTDFASRDSILAADGARPPAGWPARADVARAIILVRRGDVARAQALLDEYLTEWRRDPRNPGHEPWVRALAEDLGVHLPATKG